MLSHDTEYKFEIDQVFSSSRNFVMSFMLKTSIRNFQFSDKISKLLKFMNLH